MIRLTFLPLFLLSLLAMPIAASAQEEMMTYDPTYTGQGNQAAVQLHEAQRQSLGNKGYITPTEVYLDLVHYPYMSDDQFGIQMTLPDMVSGCYDFTPLEYETKYNEPDYMTIKVKHYRRLSPIGVQQNCDPGNKMVGGLVILDRNELKSRNVEEIKFSTQGGTDTYKINMDDAHIELIPTSMMVFKGQNMTGPVGDRLSYVFPNNKMVTLQIPMAQPDEDLTPQVLNFASTLGLSPLGEPGWDGQGRPIYYFYDSTGRTASRIGEDGYAEIGTITANRPYDGQDGRTLSGKDLSVFVTRPGTKL